MKALDQGLTRNPPLRSMWPRAVSLTFLSLFSFTSWDATLTSSQGGFEILVRPVPEHLILYRMTQSGRSNSSCCDLPHSYLNPHSVCRQSGTGPVSSCRLSPGSGAASSGTTALGDPVTRPLGVFGFCG